MKIVKLVGSSHRMETGKNDSQVTTQGNNGFEIMSSNRGIRNQNAAKVVRVV